MEQWQKYGMTKDEWFQYQDEYADYLDNIRFTGNTIRDKVAVLNAREKAEHNRRREAALNKIRQMRKEIKDGNVIPQ